MAPFRASVATLCLSLAVLGPTLVGCAAEEPTDGPATASEDDELNQQAPGQPATASQLAEDYPSWTGAEKQAALWKMVSSDDYCGLRTDEAADYADAPGCTSKLPSGGTGYGFKALKSIFSLKTSFNRESDELPQGRKKLFHPFGSSGTAEFVSSYPDVPSADSHRSGPYTGMLKNGQTLPVLIRLAPGGGGSLIPGIAVKFFVDGKPSVNLHAIQNFDGQGKDNNYFHSTPSNILPPAKSIAIRLASQIFKTVKREPNHLQVDHITKIEPSGEAVVDARAPYQLKFAPHGDIAEKFAPEAGEDFRVQLRRIPPGTVIYDVLARATEDDDAFEKIGEIKTTSWLVATGRGDYQVFFQHNLGTN